MPVGTTAVTLPVLTSTRASARSPQSGTHTLPKPVARPANHRGVSILRCIIPGVKLLAAIFLGSAPLAVAVVGARVLPPTAQEAVRPESAEFFEARVRPILAANCYDCHTEEQLGGL